MADISAWNEVDDNNNGPPPNGWPEGQMPSTANNCARAMMGALRRWRDQSQPTVIAGGVSNAQTLTYTVPPAAYVFGDQYTFYALGNTGPATLAVLPLAPVAVTTAGGAALTGGELRAGEPMTVYYDGTEFRLTGGGFLSVIGGTVYGPLTVNGNLTVPQIFYSGKPHPTHGIAFDWDGANTHVYVDGTDIGLIGRGTITGVTAGNGLTGGGTSGNVTVGINAPLSVANGGTGSTTAGGAAAALGFLPLTGGTISGHLTINYGTSDPLFLQAPSGSNCRVQMLVAGVRQWSEGPWSDGYYRIADDTAGAARLSIDTSGNIQFGPSGVGILDCNYISSTQHTGAGTLLGYGGSNLINFRWTGLHLMQRVDGAENGIVTGSNCWDLAYASPSGGALGVALNGYDGGGRFGGGTLYAIWVDAISDERIKDNIQPTAIDALELLQRMPVNAFDVKARPAAWLRTVGKSDEEREAALARAEPVHVPIGLVAQRVQELIPEAVNVLQQPEGSELPRDTHSIVQQMFVPYLVRAVQQLAARVEELERGR